MEHLPETILVTGANGQLGRELKDLALTFPQYRFLFAGREELPIHDERAVHQFFEATRIHFCINCAAYTAVDKAEAEKESAYLMNGDAVGLLAEVCKKNDTKFIHISTDYVYDGAGREPLKEDDPVGPLNTYGSSKRKGEEAAMTANPDTIIIRTSWVYSSHGSNFLKTMMRLLVQKPEISVVSDQVGCPTYAADLANAIMSFVTHQSAGKTFSGIYNYSNYGITTWYQFAQYIKDRIGSNCVVHPVTSEQYPTAATRPLYSVLDTTKIREDLSLEIPFWKDSVAKCIARIQEQ